MSERKHSMKALVGSTSTLVIGIVIGIAIDRAVVIHGHNSPHTPAVAVIASSGTDAAFRDLTEYLDLSDEQALGAHEIFSAHQASVDTAWTAVQDHLGLAIASVVSELESLLDAGQRGRLHEWMAEHHGVVPLGPDGAPR